MGAEFPAISEFSFVITKVSVDKSAQGAMRWRATASDTALDLSGERMSISLFDDFIRRINENVELPEEYLKVLESFGERSWKGGMPYLSIAHYKSGTNFSNVPGVPEKIYRDGNRLKAVGTLFDTPLGRAVFKSLCDDLYSPNPKFNDKIRISIGFVDYEHAHIGKGENSSDYVFTRNGINDKCELCAEGIGGKEYRKGQLVHLAMTRLPVNPRTDMEVDKSMNGQIRTMKDDAESIVGDLADTLEQKSLTSEDAGDPIVVKSDAPEEQKGENSEPLEESKISESKSKPSPDPQSEEKWEEDDEDERERRRNMPESEKSAASDNDKVQEVVELLKSAVVKAKSSPSRESLADVQSLYKELGAVINREVSESNRNTPAFEEVVSIVSEISKSISEMRTAFSSEIAILKAQIDGLKEKSQPVAKVPTPRSISQADVAKSLPTSHSAPTIAEIALHSTFGR